MSAHLLSTTVPNSTLMKTKDAYTSPMKPCTGAISSHHLLPGETFQVHEALLNLLIAWKVDSIWWAHLRMASQGNSRARIT